MVVSAEEDAVIEICVAAVLPFLDVVGFTPGRWPITTRPKAATVTNREGSFLVCGEGALGTAQVEWDAVLVGDDLLAAIRADDPLRGASTDRGVYTFQPGLPVVILQVFYPGDDFHGRLTAGIDLVGVHPNAGGDEFD